MADVPHPPAPAAPSSVEGESSKALGPRELRAYAVVLVGLVALLGYLIAPYVLPRPRLVSSQSVLEFDLALLSGGALGDRVRSVDLRGRPVILDFWASWCAPCVDQTRALSEAAPRFAEGTYVLGVATGDQEASASKHLVTHPTPYSNAFDQDQELARRLGITELPTLVFVDRSGRIVEQVRGPKTAEELVTLAGKL